MAHNVIWQVRNNLTNSTTHYLSRREAVNNSLGAMNALIVADPTRYWKVESWATEGDLRTTVRVGPGAGSAIVGDSSVLQGPLADVAG